ncbi:MAG: DUF721 domain-containing protein [Kiritimatiellia bacterium]
MAKKRQMDEAAVVGDVLKGVMNRIAVLRVDLIEELTKTWPDIAGKAVASHTRPAKMEGAQLVVFVDQHVWMQELQRSGKKPLMSTIWKRFGAGKVKDILFRLDPGR